MFHLLVNQQPACTSSFMKRLGLTPQCQDDDYQKLRDECERCNLVRLQFRLDIVAGYCPICKDKVPAQQRWKEELAKKPVCCHCGDLASCKHGPDHPKWPNKPCCEDCWNEIVHCQLPGPETLSNQHNVPEGCRLVRRGCVDGDLDFAGRGQRRPQPDGAKTQPRRNRRRKTSILPQEDEE